MAIYSREEPKSVLLKLIRYLDSVKWDQSELYFAYNSNYDVAVTAPNQELASTLLCLISMIQANSVVLDELFHYLKYNRIVKNEYVNGEYSPEQLVQEFGRIKSAINLNDNQECHIDVNSGRRRKLVVTKPDIWNYLEVKMKILQLVT
jgi:hypothetical protein